MKINSRIILVLVLVLVAATGLILVRNTNTPDSLPISHMQDYQLDPPGLADIKIGEVKPGVPVLCYHYFRGSFNAAYFIKVLGSVFFGMPALGPREFWTTPVGQFENHLKFFQDTNTRVMTLDEVADLYRRGEPIPEKAVVLTIDDADISVYRQAWPLLKKYNVKAHLFVPTGMVATQWSSLDVCTWAQLKEMSDSGHVLIGSHTGRLHFKISTDANPEPVFLHPNSVPEELVQDNRQIIKRFDAEQMKLTNTTQATEALEGPMGSVALDILASRLEIMENVGLAPTWLAWPYGFADESLDSLCTLLGFRGTVSLRPETYGPETRTGSVGRFTLTAKSTLERIKLVFPDNTD